MTKVAISQSMPAGERELGMVKRGRFPPRIGGVALVTGSRVLCSHVIGIGCLVIIGQVTGNTLRGRVRVIPADMAEIAISQGMPAGERELCMVKRGRFPTGIGVMTLVTGSRILCCRVVGIGGLVVIRLVAGNTLRGRVRVIPADMAEIAISQGMPAGERELCMVKRGRFPAGIGVVTLVTGCRVLCSHVIGIGCLVIIGQVTGNTFCGSIGVIPVDMTQVTIGQCMSAGERENGMVKSGGFPSRIGIMTLVTGSRVLCSHVIGIGSLVIIGDVTGRTLIG